MRTKQVVCNQLEARLGSARVVSKRVELELVITRLVSKSSSLL